MNQNEYNVVDDVDDTKSKSQIKREMNELHELGVKLSELPATHIARLPLDATLRQAVEEAPGIRQNSARKRHFKFIAKLMRHADVDAITDAIALNELAQVQATRQLHIVENWRDRLISEADQALGAFVQAYPACDRQALRQLIRAAQKDYAQGKPPKHARQLFKFLRDIITPS